MVLVNSLARRRLATLCLWFIPQNQVGLTKRSGVPRVSRAIADNLVDGPASRHPTQPDLV